MGTPSVSVIIPAFNTRPYLAQCLQSVLSQTLKDLEVIGVDNGSQDGSYELLQEFAKRHSNLKVLRHIGGRQGAARNAGLDVARGEYVGFVDSDDFVAPTMFEEMLEKARSLCADVAVCNFNTYQEGQIGGTLGLADELLNVTEMFDIPQRPKLLRNLTSWNKIFSRRLVIGHGLRFPEGLYHEDVLFTLEAFFLAKGIVAVPQPLYFYRRQREGSVNLYKGEGNLHVFRVMQMATGFFERNQLQDRYGRLLDELKATRILGAWDLISERLRRSCFNQMREVFREIELRERPDILTPTEYREVRVIRSSGYWNYRLFRALRWVYGKVLAWPGARPVANRSRARRSGIFAA